MYLAWALNFQSYYIKEKNFKQQTMLWQTRNSKGGYSKLAAVNMFQTFKMLLQNTFAKIPLPHTEDVQVWF